MSHIDCPDEQTTQHYLRTGPGPVQDDEWVVMAVFANTPHDERALRLAADSFDVKQLKRGELSLARQSYTSLADFNQHVVQKHTSTLGTLIGVCIAHTEAIRALTWEPAIGGRGICVLDKVTAYDHDGHAALEHCRPAGDHSQKKLGMARQRLCADLAETFAPLAPPEAVFT